VTRFLKLNGEMRRANNQALSDLRLKSEAHFLWSRAFRQQHNSQVESNFADVRNYIYQGKKIDQQVHLGYDLSVTQHVGVEASTTAGSSMPPRSASMATASCSTTATVCSPSTATSAKSPSTKATLSNKARSWARAPNRHGRRRPHPLQHAARRRPDRPQRVVGFPLDQGSHRQPRRPARLPILSAGRTGRRNTTTSQKHCDFTLLPNPVNLQ